MPPQARARKERARWSPPALVRMLRDLPIRRKLTLIVLVTSGLAVVVASTGFLAYDYVTFRRQMAL
ncbi:MAG: hypothetical protein LJF15_10810, partial [Acidobacteria bacterium]|nr:hypothetical protein [Acidobacteriota bacterium]